MLVWTIGEEGVNLVLNRGYRNSSGFGGRERKKKRKMRIAGDELNEIEVNRKIDNIISVNAKILLREELKN